MKIFVNLARLEIGQLFTQGTRWGHPRNLDTFLVSVCFSLYLSGCIVWIVCNLKTTNFVCLIILPQFKYTSR